jgi:hypothetical protein
MKNKIDSSACLVLLWAGLLLCASCNSAQPAPPSSEQSVSTVPGIAGGVWTDVLTGEAIISAIDVPSRRVTLRDSNNEQLTFTAGPEVRNFDQMYVGDKVSATFERHITIAVASGGPAGGGAPPPPTVSGMTARAFPGDKPAMLVAEDVEVTARIKAIDSVNRTVTLEGADRRTRTVPIRKDVDLSRYQPGDTVLAQINSTLTVLVDAP